MIKVAPKSRAVKIKTAGLIQRARELPIKPHVKNIWRRVRRQGNGRGEEFSLKDIKQEKKEAKAGSFPLIDVKVRHRILSTLAYLQILLVIPLFLGRRDSFVRHHVRQGVALLVVWAFVPFLFWLPLVGWLGLAFLLFELFWGTVSAGRGRKGALPLVARLVV
ncbi:MAG: hypothetical protein AAB360_00440 [Patescibacteria group bacterium]